MYRSVFQEADFFEAKQPQKTQVPASACADTCMGLRRYLHEATQVSALKPHSFIVIAKKVIVIVNVIVNFAISLLLIIGGFLLPPMGIVDSSVLTAVGELLMFGVLAQLPALINAARNGKSIKLTKGDFTAEVSSSQDQRTGS